MVESGVDACASDTRASGRDCVGRFSKVLKCSCHLAATDASSAVATSAVDQLIKCLQLLSIR